VRQKWRQYIFSTESVIGSTANDLSGSRAVAAATSSDDSGANLVNVAPCGEERNVGGDEPDVVDPIRSTFSKESGQIVGGNAIAGAASTSEQTSNGRTQVAQTFGSRKFVRPRRGTLPVTDLTVSAFLVIP